MSKPDWAAIEQDYLESGLNYGKLAEKYGVSLAAIKKQASRKGWGKTRKANLIDSALEKVTPHEMSPRIVTGGDTVCDRVTDAQRFQMIVEGMLDRVEEAICTVSPSDAASIKLLTAALKDLRDLKGLNKTALDLEEQKARIEKMRYDMQAHEVNTDQIVVEFVNTEGAEA